MRGLQSWTSGCDGSGRLSRTSGQTVNKTCTCDNCAALQRKRREHRVRAMRRRIGASLADPDVTGCLSAIVCWHDLLCFTYSAWPEKIVIMQTPAAAAQVRTKSWQRHMFASAISAPRIHCQCLA